MMNSRNCAICKTDLMDNERVIFSHKETFIFKPADVPDTVNAASVSPAALAESRKDHLKTAVVNTFCDWGKASIPADAFYFRHQGCEPVRTAGGVSSAATSSKHMIRFQRNMVKRSHS